MKIIMVGNVGGRHPVENGIPKPMHIPDFSELEMLAMRLGAYRAYADTMAAGAAPFISRAAHNSAAEAVSIKRHMDKLYRRWRRS